MTLSYGNGYEVLTGNVSTTVNSSSSNTLSQITMAQSSYFKISIDKLNNPAMKSSTLLKNYSENTSGVGSFLPIKSVSFTPVSLETLSIPLGVFGDMSIVNRKKIGRLSITLLDTNDNFYEKKLASWYKICVPNENGYVGYLEDMVSDMTYISYSTTGLPEYSMNLEVMLAEDISISRDYDANELKAITFNVVVVGSK